MTHQNIKSITVAISGASGMGYALHFIESALALEVQINLIMSPAGQRVMKDELDANAFDAVMAHDNVTCYQYQDIGAKIASGTSVADAMVVIPTSMGTLGKIRAGLSSNLIERAADVSLKEGKPLILLPRETPMNLIHLENMLGLAKAGAIIMPASPGFYHRPQTIEDLYIFMTGKILDRLNIPHNISKRWQGE